MRVVSSRRLEMLVMLAILGTGGLAAAGCSSPTDPTTPLQITCPASKTVESLTGNPVVVDFGSATTVGGVQPVTVTCTTQSGSSFPVGTRNVICTARDAKQRAASCGLNVAVTRVGTLGAAKFMAFGDSITFGTPASPCGGSFSGVMTADMFRRDAEVLFRMTSGRAAPATSYPSVLQGLLANRYVTETPVVINEGFGGEFVTDMGGTNDATLSRLATRISANAPDVLLLQEGINDLNAGNPLHPDVAIPQVVKALRDMIRVARSRGVRVFLGTLLPLNPDGCRARVVGAIAGANDQIKMMAASEGVTVVDLYEGFGGAAGPYIGLDGLHPNELGYEKMAQTFFGTIKATLEVPR